MATWSDQVRGDFNLIAGTMLFLAECLELTIQEADEDTDITILVNSRDWLRDRATLFSPPGEPEDGYPSLGADVINLDAYRTWRQMKSG